MPDKPGTADGYTLVEVALVRSACLSLATYLGTFRDDLVIVGGLVPTLLIPEEGLDDGVEFHVGTQDLDLGLSLALLEESRYVELVEHLKSAEFTPDVTSEGKPANHRWKHRVEPVTVDFLIAPSPAAHSQGRVRVIEERLSAVLAPAIPLAFRDRRLLTLRGLTLRGEEASRDVWVCGPGAFLVLKAHAFRNRGENKDAYDLLYVLANCGADYLTDVADALHPLLDAPEAREALEILRADFTSADSLGPHRAADFLRRTDAGYRTDRAGDVRELLRRLAAKDGLALPLK